MVVAGGRWTGIILLAGVAGCARPFVPPAGTGARAAVLDYYQALVRKDWQQAYDALHPENRARLSLETFTKLAQSYCRGLDFDPEEVHVQSCTEQGAEAKAHVVLSGRKGSQVRRYKDAMNLRHSAEGWRVVLPDAFGRALR